MPNVLLVEDDPHFAHWVAAALQAASPELEVAIAGGVRQGWDCLKAQPTGWRLAIVDMNLGDEQGIDLIRLIAEHHPGLPVLVVTAVEAPSRALAAVQSGAQGYVLKSSDEADLVRVAHQVIQGGSPLTPSIARSLLAAFRAPARGIAAHDPVDGLPVGVVEKLSTREGEVLRLLARGYSDKEAAAQLSISPATVDTHVRKIFRKLSINSRVELRRMLTWS